MMYDDILYGKRSMWYIIYMKIIMYAYFIYRKIFKNRLHTYSDLYIIQYWHNKLKHIMLYEIILVYSIYRYLS